MQSKFQGFRSPNTTPIPDELFDELMAKLSGAELKVLLYICRRTFGFKKESNNISLNQMLRGITKKDGTQLDGGVGLSKPTLLRAIRVLAKKNIILADGHRPLAGDTGGA
jgi:phage replication O-like protein O